MKKVLVGITAAACAAVMCVGLVACGPNAKDVKSIEVTEAEWNAAFEYLDQDDAEYSVDFSGKQFEKRGDKSVTATRSGSGRVKDGKAYAKGTMNVSGNGIGDGEDDIITQEYADEMKKGEEGYSAVENGTTYVYSKNDEGKWVKNVGSNIVMDLFSSYVRTLSFSSYQYNEEEKGYVLTSSSSEALTVVLKFGKVGDDVRLVAIYMYGKTNGGSSSTETAAIGEFVEVIEFEEEFELNIVFNYGSVADINLPDVD